MASVATGRERSKTNEKEGNKNENQTSEWGTRRQWKVFYDVGSTKIDEETEGSTERETFALVKGTTRG